MPETKGLVVSTSTCFLASSVLVLVSLATPAWIVESLEGWFFFFNNKFFVRANVHSVNLKSKNFESFALIFPSLLEHLDRMMTDISFSS